MQTNFIYTLIFFVHKYFSAICSRISTLYAQAVAVGYCMNRRVKFTPKATHFYGRPMLYFSKDANVKIGNNFVCRSGNLSFSIDNHTCSKIVVYNGASLTIGQNSGISNTIIHCHQQITIGNYVNIGAGTLICDTDFHSLSWQDRRDGTDIERQKTKPITIGDYAFIGANSIILKGVSIGEKSIIGAGSVVSSNIPDEEVWAGNPAHFIRKI